METDMKRTLVSTFAILIASLIITPAFGAYWTEKTQNPAYFPYFKGTGNPLFMDLEVPTASDIMVAPDDPLRGTQGYWPCYYSIGTFANGKYYVGAGLGPNLALGAPAGYNWPSNSYGHGYSYNRQSQWAIYTPGGDSWDACKWDGTGPVGFNYGRFPDTGPPPSGGTAQPVVSDGTYIGQGQSFAYDYDHDGTEEIFLHAGYPHWGGNCFIWDPDENTGRGSWSKSADANDWPSGGNKAQMNGGSIRINELVYNIGGSFWGKAGQCNMQVYNAESNTWKTYEKISGTNILYAGMAAAGAKIYILGGAERTGDPAVYLQRNSQNIYMMDTEDISAGLTQVGTLAIGVERPSVVSWNGLIYIVGGDTVNGYTNLFQVFNPLTGSVGVNDTPLPVNAAGASCAVSPDGTFYFGGALRFTADDGTNYNTSRLWIAPLPEQDLLINPGSLDFWQTNDTLVCQLDNVSGFPINCSNTTDSSWILLSTNVVTVGGSIVDVNVTVDRSAISGPTNGTVTFTWPNGSIDVTVNCDTARPDPAINPSELLTLNPSTRRFTIKNNGTVAMNFTNSTPDEFIQGITPQIGTLQPENVVTCSFDVTAAALRPGTGTVEVAFNSYNGEPEVVIVVNSPGDYYVSTIGDDNNDGLTPGTAWRNISHGITNMPQGDTENGPITLNVAAGTYAGECTDTTGTNWILDLSEKQYIDIIGAGPEQSYLTRGAAQWVVTPDNDGMPEMPIIKFFNSDNVRFSGFTIQANNPPASIDGEGDYPEHLAVIGIQGGQGIRVDHLYLNGTYTGKVYNVAEAAWKSSWEGWWYHAICLNGEIGPGNVTIDHVLARGFVRNLYNNNYGYGNLPGNTNFVNLAHCTFIQAMCPSDTVQSVCIRVSDTERGPSFLVANSIIADMPWSENPGTVSAIGLMATALDSMSSDYTLASQSNQFWSVGVPSPGGLDFKNEYVIDEWGQFVYSDYTNEQPEFSEAGGLPYSTDIETVYGTRDVGWNVVPEPTAIMIIAGLFTIYLTKRRFI